MNVHKSHKMNETDGQFDYRCTECGTSSQSTLEQPCAQAPHSSHKLVRRSMTTDEMYCELCVRSGSELLKPCLSAAKYDPTIDYTKLEYHRPVALVIHDSHVRKVGMGPDVWACANCHAVRGCSGEDSILLEKPCERVAVHSSHRMVPSDDPTSATSATECDHCGGKYVDQLSKPCSSLAKIANMDFSKLEERVLAQMAEDPIQPEHKFMTTGRLNKFEPHFSDSKLQEAVRKASESFAAMTPEEQERHIKAQAESWARGEKGIRDAEIAEGSQTRVIKTPHGVGVASGPGWTAGGNVVRKPVDKLETELKEARKVMRQVANEIIAVSNESQLFGHQHTKLIRAAKQLRGILGAD